MRIDSSRLTEIVTTLALEEKVSLLTGADFWSTRSIDRIGLRSMVLSDGPSGVRGPIWDERDPSLSLPSATTLSSSWDLEIARQYGVVAGQEARRKGVDVVLGPTINLHRSPLGGRHFEAFSEDPFLTGELAAAYVRGVQSQGVAATPKHYVANDSETDRFTVNVVAAERTLRELYLLPFRKAVEAGAWAIMSSYNSVNGATATENDLLRTPLKDEWGFDGVVISDWTAVRSLNSARFAQDLAMPGPGGPWGDALVSAVRTGEIDESLVDDKVIRLLRLAARVGALEEFEASRRAVTAVDGRAFARNAAAAGAVLLRNATELPWSPAQLTSIAVSGDNALRVRTQGGGSATVIPDAAVTTPLHAIRAAAPNATVTYSLGAVVQEGVAEFRLDAMTNPATGGPGARVRFLSAAGAELFVEDRRSTALVWFGGDAPIATSHHLEITTDYLPEITGDVHVGFAAVGTGRIFADEKLVLEATVAAEGTDLAAALLTPPSTSARLTVTKGTAVRLRLEFEIAHGPESVPGALGLTFGFGPDTSDADDLITEAVERARSAEVAVVVVGTNSHAESEGFDRSTLALPGRQDDLVRAVASANAHTVVIVNSGSPVLLPWRNDVAAILVGYFGGQEFGNALAEILFGITEPGGRLPTTWPAHPADVPVINVTPMKGDLRYDEGIHIGYRAWLQSGAVPAYPFGHGLGYTSWELRDLVAAPASDQTELTVTVANTGNRAGKQVVQVYAERADSAVERPVRWLVGFTSVDVGVGDDARATIIVPNSNFDHWAGGWHREGGRYTLRVGTSLENLPLNASITLGWR